MGKTRIEESDYELLPLFLFEVVTYNSEKAGFRLRGQANTTAISCHRSKGKPEPWEREIGR